MSLARSSTKLLARICVAGIALALSGCSRPGAIQGQSIDERLVADSLRSALGVAPQQRLDVERSYARLLFPSATFFRAHWREPGVSHSQTIYAAAVVQGDSMVIVKGLEGVGRAWNLAVVRDEVRNVMLGEACTELLVETGILSPRTAILETLGDIPESVGRRLEPRHAVREVRAERVTRTPDRASSDYYVVDGGAVMHITCESIALQLRATIDTLAVIPIGP